MTRITTAPSGQLKRPEKIHALTSLRFFAALFVVLYHSIGSFVPGFKTRGLVGRFVDTGFVSVSFFFLLSGYILAMVYLRRGGPIQIGSFFRARFARVYPLFFLTLVLDTPNLFLSRLATYGMKSALLKSAVTFLANTVMLQAWVMPLRGIDNPNWSLAVETIFYLSFPILGVLLWKLDGVKLWVVAIGLYVGGQVVVLVATPHMQADLGKFLPLLHLTTFALGILLARWQTSLPAPAAGRNLNIAWVSSAAAIAAFAAVVYWSPRIPIESLYDGLLAPIFMLLIWAFSHAEWLPARWLSAAWLVVLGEASFGLYLFHIPVLHLLERLHLDHGLAMLPVFLLLSIGISVLSFYFFETPLRKWILKKGKGHVKETMEMASDAQ